ncbi:MAG: DUF116 domain-containing protein [Deltaproteobacteria bacterium]
MKSIGSSDQVIPTDPEDEQAGRAKKRLFIGLTLGTCVLLCLFLISMWVVPYIGLTAIHPAFPWILGILIAAAVLFVVWASFGLVLNIVTGRTLPFFGRMRGVTVTLFLPLMTLLGRVLGISKARIRSSFIKVNNELVAAKNGRYAPQELLLLMPHCLQSSKCAVRLTYDTNNCKRCGKCPITGLLALSDKYGIHLAIATGGTIARRIVVQKRPRLILAVACERDLASGIQDTYPLPVFGILNRRPFGPCYNTKVPLNHLEEAIRKFLDPRYYPVESSSADDAADLKEFPEPATDRKRRIASN